MKDEEAKVQTLCGDIHTSIVGMIDRSDLVTEAETMKKTVMEDFPDSELAETFRRLAETIVFL